MSHIVSQLQDYPGQVAGLLRQRDAAEERIKALTEAIDLVDSPYPLAVFPERTDEQRNAIFAAMREVDPYATEWFYAHVARERGRVARAAGRLPVNEEAT